ncbi:MAG: tetratricopeptide repeat protein [Flavobacteriales bacterium]|nr:tetratricopeptide repeat protein [Flavobacteriales bacterium]
MKRTHWFLLGGAVIVLVLLALAPRTGAEAPEAGTATEAPAAQALSKDPRVAAILAKLETGAPPMPLILELRQLAEAEPENTEAHWNLGLMSWSTGQFDKAMDRFRTVIALDPDGYPDAYVFMARAFATLDSLDQARAAIATYKTLVQDTAQLNAADRFLLQLNADNS